MANQVQLPPGMTLAAYTSLPSTNDEAKRLAMEEQASDGTIVWSLEQTAGKGRQNRQWLSAPWEYLQLGDFTTVCHPRKRGPGLISTRARRGGPPRDLHIGA